MGQSRFHSRGLRAGPCGLGRKEGILNVGRVPLVVSHISQSGPAHSAGRIRINSYVVCFMGSAGMLQVELLVRRNMDIRWPVAETCALHVSSCDLLYMTVICSRLDTVRDQCMHIYIRCTWTPHHAARMCMHASI